MTKEIKIGNIFIGGNNSIAIQSMTNTKTKDIASTVAQIFALEKAGCDIVRVAVLDEADALAIREIKSVVKLPVVADIHFNYNLALMAIENGADKIRINPGNIDGEENLKKIIHCAKMHSIPIRIGVNSGSVNKNYLEKYKEKSTALIKSLLAQVAFFEKNKFDDLVLSVKSTNVVETVDINRKLSKLCSYPLHIGVTEAGPESVGIVKNSIGIGVLLLEGIGDTIRVSLTDNPVKEVYSAKKILRACGISVSGINFVSCPTCGRCMTDMVPLANEIYERLKFIDASLSVAVMGCAVNGPGEAKDADVGIAFGNNEAILFKHGRVEKFLPIDNIVNTFVGIVEEMANAIE